jgi:hypothetical protein
VSARRDRRPAGPLARCQPRERREGGRGRRLPAACLRSSASGRANPVCDGNWASTAARSAAARRCRSEAARCASALVRTGHRGPPLRCCRGKTRGAARVSTGSWRGLAGSTGGGRDFSTTLRQAHLRLAACGGACRAGPPHARGL